MISRYFDATYLGKLHWQEPGSNAVQLCADACEKIACSQHGRAEFYSIGFRKFREGLATAQTVRAVFAQFSADCASGNLLILPLTERIVDRVENIFATAPAETFLRAADALHLATAAEHGFKEIYSNDKHLLNAAPLFGLRGINVIPLANISFSAEP